MKKLLLFLLITGSVIAQTTAPSGYTSNYRFRLWNQGANPSADSLNANWTLADTKIKLAYDSAQTKVNLYSNQSIYGNKSFYGNTFFNNDSYVATGYGIFFNDEDGYLSAAGSGVYLTYTNTGGTDTLATLADIRGGAITGATFTDDVSLGADVRYPANSVSLLSTSIDATNKTFIQIYSDADRNLQTINGGSDGKIIHIESIDISWTITVKDAVGNIFSNGDFAMGLYDTITLIYDASNASWVELSRSNN